MDELVERLIEEETIEGDRFRGAVEAWQAEHPDLARQGLSDTADQPAVPLVLAAT
jgi:hypothetical protein